MWEMDAFIMEKFSTQASVKRPGKLEQLKPGQELEGGRINAKKRQQITSGNVFLSTRDDLLFRLLGGWKVVLDLLMS